MTVRHSKEESKCIDEFMGRMGSKCDCCGSPCLLTDKLFLGSPPHPTTQESQFFPVLAVTCSRCGRMVLANAGIIGIDPNKFLAGKIETKAAT